MNPEFSWLWNERHKAKEIERDGGRQRRGKRERGERDKETDMSIHIIYIYLLIYIMYI